MHLQCIELCANDQKKHAANPSISNANGSHSEQTSWIQLTHKTPEQKLCSNRTMPNMESLAHAQIEKLMQMQKSTLKAINGCPAVSKGIAKFQQPKWSENMESVVCWLQAIFFDIVWFSFVNEFTEACKTINTHECLRNSDAFQSEKCNQSHECHLAVVVSRLTHFNNFALSFDACTQTTWNVQSANSKTLQEPVRQPF